MLGRSACRYLPSRQFLLCSALQAVSIVLHYMDICSFLAYNRGLVGMLACNFVILCIILQSMATGGFTAVPPLCKASTNLSAQGA